MIPGHRAERPGGQWSHFPRCKTSHTNKREARYHARGSFSHTWSIFSEFFTFQNFENETKTEPSKPEKRPSYFSVFTVGQQGSTSNKTTHRPSPGRMLTFPLSSARKKLFLPSFCSISMTLIWFCTLESITPRRTDTIVVVLLLHSGRNSRRWGRFQARIRRQPPRRNAKPRVYATTTRLPAPIATALGILLLLRCGDVRSERRRSIGPRSPRLALLRRRKLGKGKASSHLIRPPRGECEEATSRAAQMSPEAYTRQKEQTPRKPRPWRPACKRHTRELQIPKLGMAISGHGRHHRSSSGTKLAPSPATFFFFVFFSLVSSRSLPRAPCNARPRRISDERKRNYRFPRPLVITGFVQDGDERPSWRCFADNLNERIPGFSSIVL